MKDFQRIGWLLLAVCTGYLLEVISGASLVINPSGEVQNQPAGKGFGLTCQGEADNVNLFTQMKWRGPKGELTEGNSGPVEVSSLGNTLLLMFKSPSTDDSGMYNCSAVYDNIDHLSTAVNLIFYQDITWEDCNENQALVISNDGKIMCRVSANPPATITWSRHGQALEDRYVTQTDGVKVSNVREEDKGEFNVRAMVSQTGRFQNRVIKVEVYVPPEIIEVEDTAEAIEGTEKTLHCKASGFPRPLYSWFDNKSRNLSHVDGFHVDTDTGTVTFLAVQRDAQGRYICRAKNPAGEAERGMDFSVIVKPEIKIFENVTTVENRAAQLKCHAYGDPPPEMSIRKDGMERPFADSDDGITLTKVNEQDKAVLTLEILATSRTDDGLYFCSAENKGAHVSKVGHLTVKFAPVLSNTPQILRKTWNGNPVNLTCIAESIPNASITWTFLGQEIRDNDLYTVYGRSAYSNLLVRPPQNYNRGGATSVYGSYKCEATNELGTQHINIDLQEARTPSALSDVTTEKKTATTLTFRFHGPQDDGGLPIRAFVVNYREENQPFDDGVIHEWSEGTTYVLGKLRPRQAYRFLFAARNEVGIGTYTEEKRIVMPKESAPEPPKFVIPGGSTTSTYPDRFQIRWTEPLNNGEKIDFFELRYFEVERSGADWKRLGNSITQKITEWESTPTYEISQLKSNTPYKVEVRAHNFIGYSLDTTMIFQTAADPGSGSQGGSQVRPPGSGLDGTNDGYHASSSDSLSSGAIAAIVIALILVIIILVDVTCYLRYQWGMFHFLQNRVCTKPINDKAKEAAAEEGKAGKGDKIDNSRTEVDNPAFDARDTKPTDGDMDVKNKSPKGSKSSIAKDSLV